MRRANFPSRSGLVALSLLAVALAVLILSPADARAADALLSQAAALTTGRALPARQENPSVAARAPLTKAVTKKTYAHIMPWFETPQTNGSWGIHWTMANQNPNNMDGSGRRQIASYYYPLIGPYGSGDKDVVEYQLLLMKYSGIDGVLIDWPGTINAWDYPKNRQNAEAIIAGAQKLGLEFGIVYEDNNIRLTSNAGVWSGDWLAQARSDMAYIRDNYFPSSNYIKVNGAPVLLDFGPQAFQNPSDWNNILSVFSQKPTFLTLWYMSQYAGSNANGEFCWIYSDFTTGLANFYNNRALGAKFGVGYPGFNAFYSAGGWDGPTFTLPHNGTGTFGQTLDLALNSGVQQIQLATWNDYGEGTMIEPTREFGNGFLTTLQLKLGVPYSQAELELINTLYQQRKQYSGDATKQATLDQAAAAFAALNVASAKDILNGGSGNTATTIPAKIAASAYSSMSGIQTETCSEGGLDVGWTEYWVGFKGPYADTLREQGLLSPEKPLHAVGLHNRILSIYSQIFELVRSQQPLYQARAASLVVTLIAEILAPERTAAPHADSEQLLEKARSLMAEDLYGAVNLAAIAETLGISGAQLNSVFKSFTSMTPYQYYISVKIQKAKEMLENGGLSIREVASRLGFSDPYYFSRLFRRKVGLPPSRWNAQR